MASLQEEKRHHHRFEMAYPIRLFSRGGQELATSQTVNISQGGTLFIVADEKIDGLDDLVNVTISMPESSYAAEQVVDFACQANVIRSERRPDDGWAAIALAFSRPLEFAARS
ncbi:MAG: PilZ domain-containing protein [Planctomycetota bacterium]|jgi:hypothetical protein